MIVSRISCATDRQALPVLAHANWVPAEGVSVSFDIRHRGTSILLNFMVREPQVRAVNRDINSPVWEDSCVEFFLSFEADINYYNFEFNAIGTVLGAYGPDRLNREWLPANTLELIRTDPSLGSGVISNLEGDVQWELGIILPVQVFLHHQISDIAGQKASANFYKCGDKLKKPHFLSWKPVLTEKPDFHQPAYFGPLEFSQ